MKIFDDGKDLALMKLEQLLKLTHEEKCWCFIAKVVGRAEYQVAVRACT